MIVKLEPLLSPQDARRHSVGSRQSVCRSNGRKEGESHRPLLTRSILDIIVIVVLLVVVVGSLIDANSGAIPLE